MTVDIDNIDITVDDLDDVDGEDVCDLYDKLSEADKKLVSEYINDGTVLVGKDEDLHVDDVIKLEVILKNYKKFSIYQIEKMFVNN